ncbi:MAG: 4Fe-4S cluster-binding domain-containing protein [Bacilli bacterium]|nr:4Fe-4S cluster-binding domain-containing protein [Bacilli bacterium]
MNIILKNCMLCPRKCGVNRYQTVGYCGATHKVRVAYYHLHEWEEPVLSGDKGSGTIFFSHCNLKCLYCQNKKISIDGYGKDITNKKLEEIMLKLQHQGAHNINLVTPTHYVPNIAKVLHKIKGNSLQIPIVYNTSSYENILPLKIMDNLVDIYLADLKYYDDDLAWNYSNCKNYFEVATMAIDEMFRQVGKFELDENEIMKKGLIVRILILPGHLDDAKKILAYLYQTYKDDIIISLMNQYTPVNPCIYQNLNRKLTKEEYQEVIDYALKLGVKYAFIQDEDTADESFIPDFDISIL